MTHVALVAVVSGERYVKYARDMIASARTHFLGGNGNERTFLVLGGRDGWPAATMLRYHVILEQADRLQHASHVFLIDADMRFVAPVGEEILAPLVGTRHPGFVGRRGTYEERPASTAFVAGNEGTTYFCGGFVGGELKAFLALAERIKAGVEADAARGLTAVWHDESHLNRSMIDHPPSVLLSPSYCYPEDDKRYIRTIWPERYEPRILALDKSKLFASLRRRR